MRLRYGRSMARLTDVVDRLLTRWLRGLSGPTLPRLDLHGFGVRDALAATEAFLRDAQQAGIAEVRIVYGKGRHSPGGRGVLREVIPRWLADHGRRYVVSAAPEPDAFGEDAAMRVQLRPRPAGDPD